MKYFVFSNEKSNKFWGVEVDDITLTTHFGRIGTDGQSSIKTFDSSEKAQKKAESLIRSKLKKGYVERDD